MSQKATVRNYFFNEVFEAIDVRDRKRLFDRLIDVMANFENVFSYYSHLEFRDPVRFRTVQEEARRVFSDKAGVKELTKKTTFCGKQQCDQEKCDYAHSIEEYKPPTCLYKEFCNDFKCVKNHGFTKEEYMTLYQIKMPKPAEINLSFTQMCKIMKKYNPCRVKGCQFAHSIEQLRPITCFKDCKKEECKLKHSNESMEVYIEKQGIQVREWMYERTSDMNSYTGIEKTISMRRDEEEEFVDELRAMEEELKRCSLEEELKRCSLEEDVEDELRAIEEELRCSLEEDEDVEDELRAIEEELKRCSLEEDEDVEDELRAIEEKVEDDVEDDVEVIVFRGKNTVYLSEIFAIIDLNKEIKKRRVSY